MSGNRKRDRNKSEKPVVLEGHKRVGKKFLPPFRQLPGQINEVSWLNRILPELIWMGVLNDNFGMRRGIELSSELARLANETYAQQKSPNFTFASSYSVFDTDKTKLLLEKLEAKGLLVDLRNGLIGFLNLYPKAPLSFLRIALDHNVECFVGSMKATLERHFFRREQPAMVLQANVLYVAGICGKLVYTNNVKPPDLSALVTNFESEEGRKAAAHVRASVTGFVGMLLDEEKNDWPRYFWNRGLDIDKCMLNGESTDG